MSTFLLSYFWAMTMGHAHYFLPLKIWKFEKKFLYLHTNQIIVKVNI